MTPEHIEYSLAQKDVIGRLIDADFFVRAITLNYNLIASEYGCEVLMSAARIGEAHDYWQEDVTRTLRDGIAAPTLELDHFKHACFIAFWLRRTSPVNEIRYIEEVGERHTAEDDQSRAIFLRYGNELCALLIGYQICALYETEIFRVKQTEIGVTHIRPQITRLEYLESLEFPQELLCDFVMILKHKSMSPYSLYLLYKSLFRHPTPSIG